MAAKDDKVAVGKGAKNYNTKKASGLGPVWDFSPDWENRKTGETYRPTNYGSGGNQIVGGVKNYFTDRSRDVANFLGDLTNMATNKKSVSGGGLGDYLYGSNPSEWRTTKKTTKKDNKTVTPPTGPAEPSLIDLLLANLDSSFSPIGNFQDGPDRYDAMIADKEARSVQDQAKLEAMYKQYADMIAASEAGVAQNYDAAGTAYQGNADQATNAINAAYDATRAAQTKQMQDLGIGDAAAVIQSRGEDAGANQAASAANIAEMAAALKSSNLAAKQAGVEGVRGLAKAAPLEGIAKRDMYNRQLSDQINQIRAQQQGEKYATQQAIAQAQADQNATLGKLRQEAILGGAKQMSTSEIEAAKIASKQGTPVSRNVGLAINAELDKLGLSGLDRAKAFDLYAQYPEVFLTGQ